MKKGQIGNLTSYVVVFLIVGLVVALGVIVMDKFRTATLEETSVTNESFTNATALAYTPVLSVDAVRINGSITLTAGTNYTVNTTANTVTILGTFTECDACTYYADYKYNANSSASDSLISSTDAITPITSDWLPIIVIVSVVGVILGLIYVAFSRFGRR